jgi:predicted ATP-grasp superfamily ATP-dependent carboligase
VGVESEGGCGVAHADYDISVPALLLTVGPHPWDYGALATVRTLGRVGVPVIAAVANPGIPAARSRYLTDTITWPTTGSEPATVLVGDIQRMGRHLGRPVVAIAGDDETAVLIAEHAAELAPALLLPPVPPGLPGRLASKGGLAELCRETDTPTPRSATPREWSEVESFARSARYPLVIKNPEPFGRLVTPAIGRTTRVADDGELRHALADWRPGVPVLLQEFITEQVSEDWYVEAVFDTASEDVVAFSGRKLRAYPEATGVGTLSESRVNEPLIDQARRFARAIGYVGVCDMDWRLDHRDGAYKLLDFNPRRGAQFRLFTSTADIDVVRALHLMLTNRPVPRGRQVEGVRHVVGLQDQRAYVAQRRSGGAAPRYPMLQRPGSERAWWAWDDPRPAITFVTELGAVQRLTRPLRGRRQNG